MNDTQIPLTSVEDSEMLQKVKRVTKDVKIPAIIDHIRILGIELDRPCNIEALAGEYIRNYLHVKRFPRISLVCKLVPVQYREYEYGLLQGLYTGCPQGRPCLGLGRRVKWPSVLVALVTLICMFNPFSVKVLALSIVT